MTAAYTTNERSAYIARSRNVGAAPAAPAGAAGALAASGMLNRRAPTSATSAIAVP